MHFVDGGDVVDGDDGADGRDDAVVHEDVAGRVGELEDDAAAGDLAGLPDRRAGPDAQRLGLVGRGDAAGGLGVGGDDRDRPVPQRGVVLLFAGGEEGVHIDEEAAEGHGAVPADSEHISILDKYPIERRGAREKGGNRRLLPAKVAKEGALHADVWQREPESGRLFLHHGVLHHLPRLQDTFNSDGGASGYVPGVSQLLCRNLRARCADP